MQIGGVLVALAVAGAGCAENEASRRREAPSEQIGAPPAGYRPGQYKMGGDEDAQDQLKVQSEQGALDQGEVDRAIEANLASFIACYERAGDARKYVAGQVNLRFLVARTGAVSDVLVTESTLGSYPVERCLVVEGRKIKLRPTGGQKDTDFDYSLTFRSSGEVGVTEWAAEAIAPDVETLAPTLASCGRTGQSPVRAVVYVGAGGVVTSAGLSSETPLEPAAAMCVVEQIHKWQLKDDAGRMVRATFVVPTGARLADNARPGRGRAVAKHFAGRARRARR